MTELDPADLYRPPATRLAEAIQYPLDERWANRVMNAYRLDAKTRQKPAAPRSAS